MLDIRYVPDSLFEAADMDRRGVTSCASRGLFSVELGRLDMEDASGRCRSISVDARGVEKMSTAGSWSGAGIGDAGEECAEVSRGSRA